MLAFDFGTRRVGVAIGNTLVRDAHRWSRSRPMREGGALRGDRRADRRVAAAALVVGLPMHPDGARAREHRAGRRFARQLRARFGLPVREVDERYTTELAGRAAAGRRGATRRRRATRSPRRSSCRRGSMSAMQRAGRCLTPRPRSPRWPAMRDAVASDAALVGIWSGGAWLAERLAQRFAGEPPRSASSTSRASRRLRRARPEAGGAKRTELPLRRRRRDIVLVDDVLYTGRTSARRSTSCSTSAGRRASSWRCWSTAAAASCRSQPDLRRRAPRRRPRAVDRAVARRRRRASLAVEPRSGN